MTAASTRHRAARPAAELLSPWGLLRLRFSQHRLAVAALWLLAALYVLALFAEFFAPYPSDRPDLDHAYCPPQPLRFGFRDGLYVYAMRGYTDPVTFRRGYVEDRSQRVHVTFFARGVPYRLWGILPAERRFLGVDRREEQRLYPLRAREGFWPLRPAAYLLGADRYGRDILSRILLGARISLSVSLVGILFTLVLGVGIGGASGYFGGWVDLVIQRGIEVLNALPRLPLWLALGAALPPDWSAMQIYLAVTAVLGLLGWTRLARVVRGKILSLREADFVLAAHLAGAGHGRILFRHLVPGVMSHLIVTATLSIPVMILGETSLSFLGLGLRPPMVSWGVMLQDCMDIRAVGNYPWLMLPVVLLVLTVLCFNFFGDGLRDAADPRATR